MVQRTPSDEANDCRRLAEEVEGEADKAILRRIAREFDRLAELARGQDQVKRQD